MNGVKSVFGVSSPSKVFHQIGEYLDEGLANGIMDGKDGVMDAMEDLAGDMADEGFFDDVDTTLPLTTTITSVMDDGNSETNDLLRQILDAMYNMGVLVDKNSLVSGISSSMDRTLGDAMFFRNREAII